MNHKDYHCCATCKHFLIKRESGEIITMCNRLGYETKTYYKFNCWNPRDDIKKKMTDNA
jgi:hypothetical protein